MGHNLSGLAAKGRAYSEGRPWHAHELDAVLLLMTERHLNRENAANYVRNGIETLDAYDAASKKNFKPKTRDEAKEDMEKELKGRGSKVVKSNKK